MKILVTGANGQLGVDVLKASATLGLDCQGATRRDFDITDRKAVLYNIMEIKPQIVIHCAAYNFVDRAEDELELCYDVNTNGSAYIAQACKLCGAKMVYVSTDYVFDGCKQGQYDPNDLPNPLSIYGKSKAKAELAIKETLDMHFIVRTSWLFGSAGNNFVKTMLKISKTTNFVNIVNDQIGSPTYTADLASLLLQISFSEKYGTYHATNENFCSWADFSEEIFKLAGIECRVQRISSREYPTKAIRPQNSCLSKEKLLDMGFYKLPSWQDALGRYLQDEQVYLK